MKGLIKLGSWAMLAVVVVGTGGWAFSGVLDKVRESAVQAKAQVQTEVFKAAAKEGLEAAKAEVTKLISKWQTDNPKKDKLVVGWADYDAPPNIMFTEEGDAFGFDVDLFNVVITDMGIEKFEHVYVPFAELLPGVESGKFDVAISAISETPGREERVDFTHSYMTAGLMIAVPYKMGGAGLLHSAPGILWSLGAFIVVILVFALLMSLIEGCKDGSEIKNFDDACQLVFYYMSTIGSGDLNPKTRLGRVVLLLAFFSGAVVIGNVIAEITSDRTIARLQTSIQSPDDLKGKTVATVKATTSVTALDKLGAIPVLCDNIAQCWEMLDDEAVQAVVFDAPTIRYYALRDGKGQIAITGDVFNEEHFGMAVAEGSPLREALNLSLLRIRDSGQYQEIWDKWFSEDSND